MKARIFVMLAVVVLLAAPALQLAAQDNEACDWTAIAENIRDELIPDILSGTRTSDEIADGLTTIARFIDVTYATCHGWTFEGTGNNVYGPFELEPGVYIVDYAVESSQTGLMLIRFEGVNGSGYESVHIDIDGPVTGRDTIRISDRNDSQWLVSVEGSSRVDSWTFSIINP